MRSGPTRALIATDGSDLAVGAARRGVALLGPGVELTVVRVVPPTPPTDIDDLAAAAAMVPLALHVHADVITQAEVDVGALCAELPGCALGEVIAGDPGMELCRYAEVGRFDVMVIGSHGSGWLKRVLLGSVSHHVLHHSTCPVLVIPEGDAAAGHDRGSGEDS